MEQETNPLGQPVGMQVKNWAPPDLPAREMLRGRNCRVEPLDAGLHAGSIYEADQLNADGCSWTYLAYGPFPNFSDYRKWVADSESSSDPLFFAIVDRATDRAIGIASYLRIDPRGGSIEIGHLHFSPLLQRTPAATEAIYLLADRAFQLGYRRLEWKCDALNAPSRRAAQRLGFSFEGVFRQAAVVKGRNRDTAWYSVLDTEWTDMKCAFIRWLDPANFTADGAQIVALSALTAPLLKQIG